MSAGGGQTLPKFDKRAGYPGEMGRDYGPASSMITGSKAARSSQAAALARRGFSILLYLVGSGGLAAMGLIPFAVIWDGVSGNNFDQIIVGFIMLLFFEVIPIAMILAGGALIRSHKIDLWMKPSFALLRER
jgi:hypothetical protein